jgi:hypothetical protein
MNGTPGVTVGQTAGFASRHILVVGDLMLGESR